MTEELLRQYAALRAQRLALNGAQKWAFTEKAVALWTEGRQAEQALTEAAREVGRD